MGSTVDDELTALSSEFFEAVSFGAGGKPDYGRIRELFVDGGLLIKNTGQTQEISTVEQFIEPRQAWVDSGRLTAFGEKEIEHRIDVFGRIAQYLCTYAKTSVMDDSKTDVRGVVSTHFVQTPAGWKMSSMIWDDERDGLTIPTLG